MRSSSVHKVWSAFACAIIIGLLTGIRDAVGWRGMIIIKRWWIIFLSLLAANILSTTPLSAAHTQALDDHSRWLHTTAKIRLGPYLALPVLLHPTTPSPPNNRRNQLSPNTFGDNGNELIRRAENGKQSSLPNRVEELEKYKLQKYEGTSTVSVADNEEVQGSLSDNVLEEFYRTPMSFGTDNLTMVTSQVGATAFLPCRVHYIGDGVVREDGWRVAGLLWYGFNDMTHSIRRSRGSGGRTIIY